MAERRMQVAADTPTVINNEAEHRYETTVEGRVAFAEYFVRGSVITFPHTLVPPALEGKGVGSALAKAALEGAKAGGLTVVPKCPFIRAYIDRHPEYEALVDPSRV